MCDQTESAHICACGQMPSDTDSSRVDCSKSFGARNARPHSQSSFHRSRSHMDLRWTVNLAATLCILLQDVMSQTAGGRCVSSIVPRPIVGECMEVFSRPVGLRTCVNNASLAALNVEPVITRLAIADLTPFANLAQNFVNQQCRLRWQDWAVPPSFMYVCYGGEKDMEPCDGSTDYYTCTLGTCVRLVDRQDWPADWWQRVSISQFGGYTPTLYDTRVWYCSDNPGFPLGEIAVGDNGQTEPFFARSSNPWMQHHCDLLDSLGNPLSNPDAQCANVTADNPVNRLCCGFCILNNAHMMRMWNCTGLTELVGNDFAIDVLAHYCRVTQQCVEERPCLGDPVVMGDPKVLFDPASYAVECDQLDSGCDPLTSRCKWRWACDNSIEALRERLGYWNNAAAERRGRLSVLLLAAIAAAALFASSRSA
mmetsp:Transcript_43798/g.103098  ORF Transcript_43798/g.103098 Transcript_43798/m.103098 type:complete len:424 (+) Transcript_43798:228-1499(+)